MENTPNALTPFAFTPKGSDEYCFPKDSYLSNPQLLFLRSHKNSAVSIAKKLLKTAYSTSERKKLRRLILLTFDDWMQKVGMEYSISEFEKEPNGARLQLASVLGGTQCKPTPCVAENDGKILVNKNAKPWETGPHSITTPLDLLFHLLGNKYGIFNETMTTDIEFAALTAETMVYSDEKGDKTFWPQMIQVSLFIAEVERWSQKFGQGVKLLFMTKGGSLI